ncbi:unnamed protein product [Hymenolepis diminuta]|uniref:Uncharacterized protein n=1 Tax=Hymenolepis diminuta TaxID=6216 RepID=A0A0R3SN82_HYMDI|nr:unnamed protein product [Hymenolepis diminuta]
MDRADLTYEKINSKLVSVVGDSCSHFILTIRENGNFPYHEVIVNRHWTCFRVGFLAEDHFKCFTFILGLRSPCHAEIRLRLLSILYEKPDDKKFICRPESAGGLVNREFST